MDKNFAMFIPKKGFTCEDKWDKKYESFDEVMANADNKYNWCESDRCACLGCVNNWVQWHGYAKEDWVKWVENNPNPTPKSNEITFEVKTYPPFKQDNN